MHDHTADAFQVQEEHKGGDRGGIYRGGYQGVLRGGYDRGRGRGYGGGGGKLETFFNYGKVCHVS
jgi:hypothetical protein